MEQSPSGNDKRRYSRIPFDNTSLLSSGNEKWTCHLIDISMKGALVEVSSETPFKPGQTLDLEIKLLQSDVVVRMGMTIAHITEQKLGLRCEQIDAESLSHLRRLMELNLSDPDLINRELLQLGE